MVNRPKMQGTACETELVNRLQKRGLLAARLAEGGSADQGDVWALAPPRPAGNRVALYWKRLVGEGARRRPDGMRDVVVLDTEDFLDLLVMWMIQKGDIDSWVFEVKATQALNVTRVLAKAIRKANG